MRFSHREDKRGDQVIDILTDHEKNLRIMVSRAGAELISIARRDSAGQWLGFLYRDNNIAKPSQGWANHATVMGYYLHRLKDGRSFYRGHEIKGGTHSFLRNKTWHLLASETGDPASLRYRITSQDFLVTDYPLDVSVDLTYQIDNGNVRVFFRFQNNEPAIAHVGFGLHPGFAATSFESFQFQMPAGKYRRKLSPDNYLSGETEEIDFPGGKMPFAREQLPGSYILEMVDVPSREFAFTDPPSGRSVTIDLTGVPYLTLWSDGGPFLCIEPCWGLTDHHKQRAFEEKEGIQIIPAGAELKAQFAMRPRLKGSD